MKSYQPIKAIAVFDSNEIKGRVIFTEEPLNDLVHIDIYISGLNKNAQHGFHVHADLLRSVGGLAAWPQPGRPCAGAAGVPGRGAVPVGLSVRAELPLWQRAGDIGGAVKLHLSRKGRGEVGHPFRRARYCHRMPRWISLVPA